MSENIWDSFFEAMKNLDRIFGREKPEPALTPKQLAKEPLGRKWVCMFTCSISNEALDKPKLTVQFKQAKIVKLEAMDDGIWVDGDIDGKVFSGYLGRLQCGRTMSNPGCGFFNTEKEARDAYDKLMLSWMKAMKSTMTGKCKETE